MSNINPGTTVSISVATSLSPPERLQLFAYFAGFILLGLSAAIMGPTLNQLAAHTGSSLSDISILFTMRSIGYLIGAILSAFLYERFRGHRVMAVALIGIAITLFITPSASVLWVLAAITLFSRAFGGLMDTGENTLIVWALGKRVGPYMNALHLTFGIGAFLAPMLVAWATSQQGDIHGAYWAIAILAVPLAIAIWRVPSPARPIAQASQVGNSTRLSMSKAQLRVLLLILLFYFFYVGGEVTMGGWLYNYALATQIGDAVGAAALSSAFWGAYTVGRVASIPIALRWPPMRIMQVDAVGGVLCALLLWVGQGNLWLTWAGVIGVGLSLASLFPTMLAYAETRLPMTGKVTSGIMASASIGATITPWVVGQVFTSVGAASVPIAVLTSALLIGGTLLAIRGKR